MSGIHLVNDMKPEELQQPRSDTSKTLYWTREAARRAAQNSAIAPSIATPSFTTIAFANRKEHNLT